MTAVTEAATTGTGATRHIAQYAIETSLRDIPAAAQHGAKLSMLDTLGCGLAALPQPTAQTILDHIQELGGAPQATIMGRAGVKTSAPMAAMANAAMMNVLDFDGLWHIPTYVLGATLATAELTAATGEQMLEAFVVGAEIASRLREAIDALREQRKGPTYRGWYHVSVYGPIAAAVAASKLLGLDVDQTRAAIGVAANGAGGVRQNLGTTAKSLLSGNPASHGVHAALLARRGVAGDPDILEARVGLIAALCLPGECDWEPIFSALGNEYVLAAGADIKRFPSVGPTQAVIMTLMKMRATDPFELTEVESMQARLSHFSAHTDYPTDPLMAGFSWPYVLAASLVDGAFNVNHLTPDSIGNPVIRATAERLEFVNTAGDEPEALTVRLNDGRTIHRDVDPGLQLENSEGAVMTKYEMCAPLHLDDQQAKALKELVMNFESQLLASALAAAIQ